MIKKCYRLYVMAMALLWITAAMTAPAFAVDDMWTVANKIIVDVYGKIVSMAIQRMKGERLIWISDRSNGYGIELPRHHILAVRQEDGTHRFFGSQEPEKI